MPYKIETDPEMIDGEINSHHHVAFSMEEGSLHKSCIMAVRKMRHDPFDDPECVKRIRILRMIPELVRIVQDVAIGNGPSQLVQRAEVVLAQADLDPRENWDG